MKKLVIAFASLAFAFLATPQASAATLFGVEITAPVAKEIPCTLVTGNWKNAAKLNCHGHAGGGGTGYDGSSEKDCPDREEKTK